jgi:elongation factor P--beta-lysine ligase
VSLGQTLMEFKKTLQQNKSMTNEHMQQHFELYCRAVLLWNCGIAKTDAHNRRAWVRAVMMLRNKNNG